MSEMKVIKSIRRLAIMIPIMGLVVSLYAQDATLNQNISFFYFEHDEAPEDRDFNRLNKLVEQLDRKRGKQPNDLRFLKSLFYRTHHRMLRKYSSLASMNETVETGTYGCLTGTLLYALLLEHFEFDYEVIELPNHVFLKVKLQHQNVYFESTLANEGFITNQNYIELQNANRAESNVNWLQVISEKSDDINHEQPYKIIGLQELNALHHFNESVKLYKQKTYSESIAHAVEAYFQYPTEKNEMLMQLVLNKILADHDLKSGEKEALVNEYTTKKAAIIRGQVQANLIPASE